MVQYEHRNYFPIATFSILINFFNASNRTFELFNFIWELQLKTLLKMSQEKEEKIDLYYTLKPMAWFTKFFGLWPHTVRVRKSSAMIWTKNFFPSEIITWCKHCWPSLVLHGSRLLRLHFLSQPRQNFLESFCGSDAIVNSNLW